MNDQSPISLEMVCQKICHSTFFALCSNIYFLNLWIVIEIFCVWSSRTMLLIYPSWTTSAIVIINITRPLFFYPVLITTYAGWISNPMWNLNSFCFRTCKVCCKKKNMLKLQLTWNCISNGAQAPRTFLLLHILWYWLTGFCIFYDIDK